MHADGTPCPPAEVRLIESATDAEWELSDAMRGEPGPSAAVTGALPQLPAGADTSVMLRLALREILLPAGTPRVPFAHRRPSAVFMTGGVRLCGRIVRWCRRCCPARTGITS